MVERGRYANSCPAPAFKQAHELRPSCRLRQRRARCECSAKRTDCSSCSGVGSGSRPAGMRAAAAPAAATAGAATARATAAKPGLPGICAERPGRPSIVPAQEHALDSSVRNQPQQCDQHIDALRQRRRAERHANPDELEDRRQLALQIAANGPLQQRFTSLRCNDPLLKYEVGNGRHQKIRAIER